MSTDPIIRVRRYVQYKAGLVGETGSMTCEEHGKCSVSAWNCKKLHYCRLGYAVDLGRLAYQTRLA